MMNSPPRLTAVFTFLALNWNLGHAYSVTIASDDASQPAYINGWQAGGNGGTGFGPWSFLYSGLSTGLFHDPQFIDSGPLSGNSLGAPAFGLTTGDREFFVDTSEVLRDFSTPLSVGQTFSMDVDGSALKPALPNSTGNTIQLFGADGQERFGLFTNNLFNNDNWTVASEVDTGIPAGTSFHFDFTPVTADTYDLVISPIGGGAPLFTQTAAPLTGAPGTAISSIRISAYGTGSSETGISELFFDNLSVTAPGLRGDSNRDGAVDAADYVVWRKNGGSPLDYDAWHNNFGQSLSGGSSATSIAPEPTTLLALLFGMPARPNLRRRRPRVTDLETC